MQLRNLFPAPVFALNLLLFPFILDLAWIACFYSAHCSLVAVACRIYCAKENTYLFS